MAALTRSSDRNRRQVVGGIGASFDTPEHDVQLPGLPCGANAGRGQGATYAPGANQQVDGCATGIGYKENTDAAYGFQRFRFDLNVAHLESEIVSLRHSVRSVHEQQHVHECAPIINHFLMESVAPARYLRITGRTQHGQSMRPSLDLENHMALLQRTFWERSHAA
jgi:hypothetical protein